METLRLCVGYRCDGEELKTPARDFERCEPIYTEMPGWQESTVGVRRYEELPINARLYLEKLENLIEIPIDIISTGADRNETIIRRHPFD
ncbi:adenylosuccinate synthetase [Candidatus Thiomargarita nelsonii]|uniref:Adenylosuccinate synthetase n=1 Tax=Candidatus Thiomargarita nelsonii TaxID=1003181 RepID=A0A176RSG5_9GAMM|nr:adenylosuccinate synthetase [Candidatus Thiomargarita nelsonii]